MANCSSIALFCVLALAAQTGSAHADPEADKAAITARLRDWAAAFNARDGGRVCDLFAPDLVASTPELLDQGRAAVCGRLRAVLTRPGVQLHYDDPDIKEIMMAGDLAVVRLVWTLRTRRNGAEQVSTESGMDIFRRQPDGRWSIGRFIAFSIPSNKNRR